MKIEGKRTGLLSTKQLAKILNCSSGTLHNNRCRGKGLPYYKIGRRVMYHPKDVQAYLKERRVEPKC